MIFLAATYTKFSLQQALSYNLNEARIICTKH